MTRVEVNGVQVNYRIDGPAGAPALLLSHALGTDQHMWDPQIEVFSSRFRVVRYDSRGHGASDAPPGPYTIEQLGDDVIALLDALEIERADVCGISMGGMVTLWLAAHHPERVDRAVHACTAARIGAPDVWETRVEMVRSGGMRAVTEIFAERFFSESFRDHRPEAVRAAQQTLEATSPDGYIASCYALRDADLRDAVPAIRVPSLIVAATNDVSTPVAEAEWLHARMPGSRLLVIDDAAHLCNVEQPDRFGSAVLEFLGTDGNDRSVAASRKSDD